MIVYEQPLCDRLGDGTLSCPGQPVEPVDGGLAKVPRPVFNLVQDGSAGSSEASLTFAMSMLGLPCRAELVEDARISCRAFVSGVRHHKWKMF